MQTFLPYPSFDKSAKVLDYRRLGKQRLEAYQILRTITGQSDGWKNHPIVKMWAGYPSALKAYLNACIKEWKKRGYKNTMKTYRVSKHKLPPFIGNEQFHASHRSNLLRKDFNYYSKFNWKEADNLPYVWG